MRHVKTRAGGRIVFACAEWAVYLVGSKTPVAAGLDFYADKYYEDRDKMPLWEQDGSGLARAQAYAYRSTAFSLCGKPFGAATPEESKALANAHAATCEDCRSEEE